MNTMVRNAFNCVSMLSNCNMRGSGGVRMWGVADPPVMVCTTLYAANYRTATRPPPARVKTWSSRPGGVEPQHRGLALVAPVRLVDVGHEQVLGPDPPPVPVVVERCRERVLTGQQPPAEQRRVPRMPL